MRKIIILFLSILLVAPVFAQENKKEQKKAEKQAKKEERAQRELEAAAIMKASLETRQFVLEADFLADKGGRRISVQSNLNFVGIDGDKGAFQFGSGQAIGYNGVGGVTVEGNVKDFKLTETKNGNFIVDFRIVSSFGNIFVNMSVSSGGNATANVKGNSSTTLRYSGTIVPLGASRVYKGSRTL